jgi:chitodextrinase
MSHIYTRAGTYTVWLNVTDGVGHLGSSSITVIVNDTEAPIAKMTIEAAGTLLTNTAPERTMLTFDASGSSDNSKDISSFHWEFGDGTSDNGVVVNHSFATAGTYKVVLMATDPNGNAGNTSRTLTISYGPRPDLRALSIVIDPASYAAGDQVTIELNLINTGTANATDVYVVYYLIDLAGNRQEIGNSSQLFVNGTAADHLGPGESGYVALTYSFASKGSYNLEADVHSLDEVEIVDNVAKQSISVNEGASILLLVAIVVALIGIVVAVMVVFRNRIFKALKK